MSNESKVLSPMPDECDVEFERSLTPVARESLRAMCEELMLLADSEPTPENESLHREWLAEMGSATLAARNKVDRVVMFIRRLEGEVEWAKQEAAYYADRARAMASGLERIESYCVSVVEQYAPDPPLDKHGKPRHPKRLEGRAGYIAIQRNPASVALDDEARAFDLPRCARKASVNLSGEYYDHLIETLTRYGAVVTLDIVRRCTEWSVDRKALKAALMEKVPCPTCKGRAFADAPAPDGTIECKTCGFAGSVPREIPGAKLKPGGMRLLLPRAGKAEVAKHGKA